MRFKTLLAVMAISAAALAQTPKGIDKSNMDLTKKPGTDFFEYAGGGWMKANPLDAEHSRYAQFNKLGDLNEERLRDIITGLAAQQNKPGSLEQKIASLYRLAMDSTRRNAEGAQPIMPTVERIRQAEDKQTLWVIISQLFRQGVPTFINAGVGADEKVAKNNIVQIMQSGLTLNNRDYYLQDDDITKGVRENFCNYATKVLQLVGNTEQQAQTKMQQMMAIETRLAGPTFSKVELRNPEANYHKLTYTQLQKEYAGIDWSTFFLQNSFPAFDEVVLGQPAPIHEVEKIWAECTLDELKAYTEFKLVNDAANALSDDFRALSFGFYGCTMSGAQQDRPRWKRAVGTVDNVLGEAVGQIYVQRYFPESSKQRMTELVNNLAVALGERIDAQEWMSQETKQRAHEKLSTFYVKIGYPNKWKDYSTLTIDESLSFYENMCRAAIWNSDNELYTKVGKPVDKDEWFMTPQTINAYYNPTTNEICFPAGILQPPFFDPEADDAINYGAIGVVIGHEMTHGFDDQGAQYDKDGNLNNWWAESDFAAFNKRTDMMADFYDKIEVLPGMMANGRLTLGENMADHGGLMVAHQAYKNAVAKAAASGKPLAMANDGFTPDQRFFLSYALVWANNIREEALRQLNKMDPHSPGRWRVNGALPHIDAWYKAFGISKKDPLYLAPKNRVVCW